MTFDQDLVDAFLVEGRELVARAADDLTALRRHAADAQALDGLFRTVHTLKGSAGLFDLAALTTLQHAAESRLEGARRDGSIPSADIESLTAVLDLTEAWLDVVEAGREPASDLMARTAALSERLEGRASAAGERLADGGQAVVATGPPAWALELAQAAGETGAAIAVRYRPAADAFFRGDDPLAICQDVPGLRALSTALSPGHDDAGPYDPFQCRLDLRVLSVAPESDVRDALRLVAGQVEFVPLAPQTAGASAVAGQTIRVDADQVDRVAALVDELVIAKNALDHVVSHLAATSAGSPHLRDLALRRATLERVVGGLHGAVTDLRLVSLRGLFARFPRHVREAASGLGKAVAFEVTGEDVVLDKAVVEQLFEPLLHLLRNAIDHGVETPDARRAGGKPEVAAIRLAARSTGDVVTIEIADDGRGVDVRTVRDLAVARGLLTRSAADALDDVEAAQLIFAAGFSTATEVGALSGRGVGMDAVRETARRLGGRIDLDNRPGLGLSVSLVLPARTVLTRVLVVEAAGERFAAPLEAISQTHRVRADEVTPIRQGRAYVRRDTVIPLVRLRTLLALGEGEEPPVFPVLMLEVDGEPRGVQVDGLGAQLEAPLRPLDGLLQGFPGIMGSILEGDGRVLLVLDLAELAA